MTQVFRVEGPDGVGPYMLDRCFITVERPSWVEWGDFAPTPEMDFLPPLTREHIFGCKDLTHLFNWFGHEKTFEELQIKRFFVVEQSVPDSHVAFGGTQVMYKRRHITKSVALNWDLLWEARNLYVESINL